MSHMILRNLVERIWLSSRHGAGQGFPVPNREEENVGRVRLLIGRFMVSPLICFCFGVSRHPFRFELVPELLK